jgi:nucleoid-associated protein YejK
MPRASLYINRYLQLQATDTIEQLLEQVKRYVGKAHNYGPTQEEIQQQQALEAEKEVENNSKGDMYSLCLFLLS